MTEAIAIDWRAEMRADLARSISRAKAKLADAPDGESVEVRSPSWPVGDVRWDAILSLVNAINRGEFCGAAPGHLQLTAFDGTAVPRGESGPVDRWLSYTFRFRNRHWNEMPDADGTWRLMADATGRGVYRLEDFGGLP